MAIPLLAPLATGAASLVGWQGAKKALPKAGQWLKTQSSKLGGFIGSNKGAAAGAGGLAGFGYADVTQKLGIEDERLGIAVYGALVVGALVAVGQLFDINVDL